MSVYIILSNRDKDKTYGVILVKADVPVSVSTSRSWPETETQIRPFFFQMTLNFFLCTQKQWKPDCILPPALPLSLSFSLPLSLSFALSFPLSFSFPLDLPLSLSFVFFFTFLSSSHSHSFLFLYNCFLDKTKTAAHYVLWSVQYKQCKRNWNFY